MSNEQSFTLPDGFKRLSVSTATGSGDDRVEYSVEAVQATSLEALREYYDSKDMDADAVLLDLWNKSNEQAAKQTAKSPVLEAVKAGEDPTEAIEAHQADARTRIIGAPRKAGGPTKKQREEIGTRIAAKAAEGKAPTQAEVQEIMNEVLGL